VMTPAAVMRRHVMRGTMFRSFARLAAPLSISFALLAAACGQSTPTANQATPSATGTPAGGPVPAQLLGDWVLPVTAANAYLASSGEMCPTPLAVATCMFKLTFTPTTYIYATNAPGRTGGGGNAVVNGTELDFFNGEACGLSLPAGVGRYRWTLASGVLKFAPLNQDECPRAPLLANQSYSRPS
jgi:hypothetical protein